MLHHLSMSARQGARLALIVGVAALATWSVATITAQASKGTACKAGQVAIRYQPRGHKRGARWCLPRVTTPRTQAAAAISIDRLLASGTLAPKRLRGLVPHLPVRLERSFSRARARQLRRTMSAPAGAHAAGASGLTQSEGAIAPGAGQAGFGFQSETTSSSTGEDAERSTVRKTQTSKTRHELFGPKCPDFTGDVLTKINMLHTSIRSIERRGKRTTITTEAHITGFISGGFDDDFALRAPLKMELDVVVETRVVTVIALTDKVVSREPTDTRRVAMTGSVATDALGAIESISDAADAMKITGAGGPKGVLTNDDFTEGLAATVLGSIWLARTEARTAFAQTVGNATGFKCVVATATPSSLTLDQGESGAFAVVVKGLDDGRALPLSSDSRVYSGNLQLSPLGNKIHGPESGTTFHATSGGGKSVAEVSSVSRRGYGGTLKIPIAPRPVFVPKRYSGTYSGTSDLSTGTGPVPLNATFDGTIALVPLPPDVSSLLDPRGLILYRVESGSLHLSISGTLIDGCELLAEGTVDLLADPGAGLTRSMTIAPTAPATYSLILGPPLIASVPGAITGCPNPADDHSIDWYVATGVPAIIYASPDLPVGAGGAIRGTYSGREDPSSPLQTWTWNLMPG